MRLMQAMVPVKLADNFFGVRILALVMPQPNLKLAIDSLRCFPFLEKLHIEVPIAKPCLLFYCYIAFLTSYLIYWCYF